MADDKFVKEINKIIDIQKLGKILSNDDDLGVVLRTHFIIEQLIELWIKAVTSQDNFFKDISGNQLNFSVKLKIAKNTEIPDSIAGIFSKINKMRNEFAHADKTCITNEDIEALETMINNTKCTLSENNIILKNTSTSIDGVPLNYEEADNLMKYRLAFCILLKKVQDKFITNLLNKTVL